MRSGWVRYAAAPVTVFALAAAGAYVALDELPLEQAVSREQQAYYEASFLDPTSMCAPQQRVARVGVRLQAAGEPTEVVWRITSDVAPDAVEFGTSLLQPGEESQINARMPIRRRGVTTIRFATTDWEHELHYRCTPQSSLAS